MSEKKINEQAKMNFKIIGGAVAFLTMLVVLTVWLISGKSKKTESLVAQMRQPDSAAVTEHSPRYQETVQRGNEQRRAEAEKSGHAAIPTIIGTPAALAAGNQGPAAAAPPPPPPQTAARHEMDEKDQRRKLVIDHLLESEWGKVPTQATVLVDGNRDQKKEGEPAKQVARSEEKPVTQDAAGNVVLEKGTLCYGVIHSPINTDNPGRIMGELIHCPGKTADFSGAKIYGTFERQDITITAKFDLLHHRGAGYQITALALDEKTSSGVLSGEVDRHVFTRYWLPMLSEFVAGWGTAAARSNTSVTVSLGGTTQTQGELSTKDQLLSASGQAAKTVNQMAQEAIKGKEITVKREGNTTIGVVFLENVIAKKP